MSPDVVLRARTPGDVDELGRILVAQQSTSGYPIRTQTDPAAFVARPTQVAAWVVEVDGALAGHVALADVPADHGFAAAWSAHHGVAVDQLISVSALFVDTGRTGLGLGGRLFDHALAEAAALGRPVVLDTIERRSPANELYARRGFVVVGRLEQDWAPGGVMTIAMAPGR